MTAKYVRRGYDPNDPVWFSGRQLDILQLAHADLRWLVDRGYKISTAATLVGNHYQLVARQRNALLRSTCSSAQYDLRMANRLGSNVLNSGPVLIDGLNVIITLETALSKSMLITGDDGVLRDLASLRGSYRIISQTSQAINLLFEALSDLGVTETVIYLDAPVSNSGKLRQLLQELSTDWKLSVKTELVPDPDACLHDQDRIVTGDAVILDRCRSWLNLARSIVRQKIADAWIVDLSLKQTSQIMTKDDNIVLSH